MAKFEKTLTGNFESVVNRLEKDIPNSGITMNLVEESDCTFGDTKVAVRVYDKYFMRNGSRASLSLTVVGHGNELFVSAIGAGGGQGIIFNFSLGAEDEMVDVVRKSLARME